jgi:hypothetical protein
VDEAQGAVGLAPGLQAGPLPAGDLLQQAPFDLGARLGRGRRLLEPRTERPPDLAGVCGGRLQPVVDDQRFQTRGAESADVGGITHALDRVVGAGLIGVLVGDEVASPSLPSGRSTRAISAITASGSGEMACEDTVESRVLERLRLLGERPLGGVRVTLAHALQTKGS